MIFRLIENADRLVEHKSNIAKVDNEVTDRANSRSNSHSTEKTSAVAEAQTWSINHEGEVVLGVYTETSIAPQSIASCLSSSQSELGRT